ncbi:PEP-CTERM sorting domain-containing protein [Methylotenera sp.]|uniref:PEP-CTERM sorting domain-containing protein n=1 Tax=Methylotenera sp. TaxID=2051956 RepID=UPI002488AADD|nr:PEP-CTERM sorting domain-containing protein [Methylotenera sp.]MDI1298984.1 PEP-CTERM sorting domain-containing protein [Methylotenera sp.]
MKLFNFVLALTFAALPVVAAANNHDNFKHENSKNIFVVSEGSGFYKNFLKPTVDLESRYLIGASNKLSTYSKSDNHKQFSVDSFQSKFESEDRLSEGASWFGGYKFLTNTNFNYFLQAANNHSPFLVIVVFSDSFKNFDWNHSGWDGHHEWDNHHGWNQHHSAPVPEPTAYALMLAGLLMLGFIKRRKN